MGQIRVTIQEVSRLAAITMLSETVLHLAKALSATPQVTITDCYITSSDVGICVDTSPDVAETRIFDTNGVLDKD